MENQLQAALLTCNQGNQALVVPKDLRKYVERTGIHPYNAVGRIVCTFTDKKGNQFKKFGIGSCISPDLIITAANAIYEEDKKIVTNNTIAKEIYFIPEANKNKNIKIVNTFFPQKYLNKRQKYAQKYEIAILLLQENNIITNDNVLRIHLAYKFQNYKNNQILMFTYIKNEQQFEQKLKSQKGLMIEPHEKSKDFHYYGHTAYEGDSGTPLLMQQNNQFFIIGVHKGNYQNQNFNYGVKAQIDLINAMIQVFQEEIQRKQEIKRENKIEKERDQKYEKQKSKRQIEKIKKQDDEFQRLYEIKIQNQKRNNQESNNILNLNQYSPTQVKIDKKSVQVQNYLAKQFQMQQKQIRFDQSIIPNESYRRKRIQKQFSNINKIKQLTKQTFEIIYRKNDYARIVIYGPKQTPYENGKFYLDFKYPQNYPFRAPIVKFKTKILHPNIYQNGYIDLDILQDQCHPALTLGTTVLSIASFLNDPNPYCSHQSEIAKLYLSDRNKFNQIAKKWTQLYAF